MCGEMVLRRLPGLLRGVFSTVVLVVGFSLRWASFFGRAPFCI